MIQIYPIIIYNFLHSLTSFNNVSLLVNEMADIVYDAHSVIPKASNDYTKLLTALLWIMLGSCTFRAEGGVKSIKYKTRSDKFGPYMRK